MLDKMMVALRAWLAAEEFGDEGETWEAWDEAFAAWAADCGWSPTVAESLRRGLVRGA
jgi:hypothetical protein